MTTLSPDSRHRSVRTRHLTSESTPRGASKAPSRSRTDDLRWLGLILMAVSAALVIALVVALVVVLTR